MIARVFIPLLLIIILPDVWHTPTGVTFAPNTADARYSLTLTADGLTYTQNGDNSPFELNPYTPEQWHLMEAAGAVFLPAAGVRTGADVSVAESVGLYHSATAVPADAQQTEAATYALEFMEGDEDPYSLAPQAQMELHIGMAVRLIRSCEPDPETGIAVAATDILPTSAVRKVLRNGQVLIERGGKTYTLMGDEVKW